jgi:hypothetical protein
MKEQQVRSCGNEYNSGTIGLGERGPAFLLIGDIFPLLTNILISTHLLANN